MEVIFCRGGGVDVWLVGYLIFNSCDSLSVLCKYVVVCCCCCCCFVGVGGYYWAELLFFKRCVNYAYSLRMLLLLFTARHATITLPVSIIIITIFITNLIVNLQLH